MSRFLPIATSTALIGAGALAWALTGHPLTANPELDVPLNPLGINGSPYGEVIAMAMQGPINTYTEVGMSGSPHHHQAGEKCDACEHADHSATADEMTAAKANPTLEHRFGNLLSTLAEASVARTNPKAASEALKRHLRRQAEDKLRFAYQLDPAHYGNYNTLHFFLTEPALGTRPELTPSAAKLAEDTIQYCLKQDQDPRPALTAAAAATNLLQLMFDDRRNPTPKFTTTQMRQCLALLDHCLARHTSIAQSWTAAKQWDLLSPQRITECEARLDFICTIRDAAEKTIARLEAEAHPAT
jgi:hypothetical protein